MKTMRSAFLAATTLAALTGIANAQSIDPVNEEIGFQGQLVVTSATSAVITGTGPTAGQTTPVGASLAGVGYVSSGALFTGDLFAEGSPIVNNALYTFTLQGLTVDPDSISAVAVPVTPVIAPAGGTAIVASYTGGTINIWQRETPLGRTYSDPATDLADFAQGTPFLTADIINLSSNFFDPGAVGGNDGQGQINGLFQVTGGTILTDFLAEQGLTVGVISSQIFENQSAPGYTFALSGRADIIPEPATMALFGAGLLPLGAFLRRRKS